MFSFWCSFLRKKPNKIIWMYKEYLSTTRTLHALEEPVLIPAVQDGKLMWIKNQVHIIIVLKALSKTGSEACL